MVPIEMQGDDFISTPGVEDDYGYAIEKYKAKIKEGNVILIANLNEVGTFFIALKLYTKYFNHVFRYQLKQPELCILYVTLTVL